MSRSLRIADLLLALGFGLCIWLPLADNVLGLDPVPPRSEQRELNPKPRWAGWGSVGSYPDEFEAYYRDHVGFRSWMIKSYSNVKYRALRASSTSTVVVGKEGWLFFRGGGGDFALRSYRADEPYSDRDLARWRRILEHRQGVLAEAGVRFLFVMVPNKHTVYAEYLPDHVKRLSDRTRADQLVDYLNEHSSVPVLDLRSIMISAKSRGLVYRKTGTHWNPRGKQIAAEVVVERCREQFPSLGVTPLDRYDLQPSIVRGAGLARMLGLEDEIVEEEMSYSLKPPGISQQEPPAYIGLAGTRGTVHIGPDETTPRLVVVGDSFGEGLMPFLAPSFSRATYVRHVFDMSILGPEKPDLVIHQMVERFVMTDVPQDPETTNTFPSGRQQNRRGKKGQRKSG